MLFERGTHELQKKKKRMKVKEGKRFPIQILAKKKKSWYRFIDMKADFL